MPKSERRIRMKKTVIYACIIVVVLALTGCGQGGSIAGKWLVDRSKYDIPEEFGEYVFTARMPISFWEDGSFSVIRKYGDAWTTGEYEYSKGKLVLRTVTVLCGTHSTHEYSYKCSIKGNEMVLENDKGKLMLIRQE